METVTHKRDRSLCSGKDSGKHSKMGRMHAGSFGSGIAFHSKAEGNKDMSDMNVKRRLRKMSKINVAHHEVSKLGVFGED
jgi:hypothetical protein